MKDKLNALCNLKVVVVGDVFLDKYTHGVVERISPEAPVPILKVTSTQFLPGGAGNVALNLCKLGVKVALVGLIGADDNGDILTKALDTTNIDTSFMARSKERDTIVKERMISSQHQLLRVDVEDNLFSSENENNLIRNNIRKAIASADIVAVSDYAKGCISKEIFAFIVKEAQLKDCKVIVDPKGVDFSKYRGSYLVKPNESEAYKAASCDSRTNIAVVGQRLIDITGAKHVVITRSEKGMVLFSNNGSIATCSSCLQNVADVTGAGDTALSTIAALLGVESNVEDVVEVANVASGLVVKKFGCAQVTINELQSALIR